MNENPEKFINKLSNRVIFFFSIAEINYKEIESRYSHREHPYHTVHDISFAVIMHEKSELLSI
jgi:hypothetical protein